MFSPATSGDGSRREGAKNMSILVRHAMTESPQTIKLDASAADAAGLMRQLDVGVIPIADGEELKGLVTDRDIVVRVIAERKEPNSVPVGDIMTKKVATVTPDMQLSEAREIMEKHKVRRLPVVKDEKLVGILSLGDVAWASESEREVGDTLREVSESEKTREHEDGGPDRGTPARVKKTGTKKRA
jgi:CBS domain-containing protein